MKRWPRDNHKKLQHLIVEDDLTRRLKISGNKVGGKTGEGIVMEAMEAMEDRVSRREFTGVTF